MATTTAMVPLGDQLARDGRTDDLDAAILDGVAERLLHLGDRCLLLLLGRLRGDADEDVVRRAEFLDLNLAEIRARSSWRECRRDWPGFPWS